MIQGIMGLGPRGKNAPYARSACLVNDPILATNFVSGPTVVSFGDFDFLPITEGR